MKHYNGIVDLIFVTDTPQLKSVQSLAQQLSTQTVLLDDFFDRGTAEKANLVFDVDLSKIETVRRMKVSLAPALGLRIFLVDNNRRVTSVHAQVLGADCLLPRPATAGKIHAALAKHQKMSLPAGIPEVIGQSIDQGLRALDQGFQSLINDTAFNLQETSVASGRIADAISEMGAQHWLATVKQHHVGTFQHCLLVTGVVTTFAAGLGMNRDDVLKLTLAAMLHDIGKAAIPLEILDKAGSLGSDEMEVMRQHPAIGHQYLTTRSTIPASILRNVRHHHELLDGGGYPEKLADNEIDDITRIVTISDIYAALTERRSYKAPKTPTEALTILDTMVSAGKLEKSLVREFGRILVH